MSAEKEELYKTIIADAKQLGAKTTDDLRDIIGNLPGDPDITGADFEILRKMLKIKN